MADPQSASGVPLFKAETVSARLAISPLLRGALEATEIELVKPVVRLVLNERGGGSWQSLGTTQMMSGYMPSSVTLNQVTITRWVGCGRGSGCRDRTTVDWINFRRVFGTRPQGAVQIPRQRRQRGCGTRCAATGQRAGSRRQCACGGDAKVCRGGGAVALRGLAEGPRGSALVRGYAVDAGALAARQSAGQGGRHPGRYQSRCQRHDTRGGLRRHRDFIRKRGQAAGGFGASAVGVGPSRRARPQVGVDLARSRSDFWTGAGAEEQSCGGCVRPAVRFVVRRRGRPTAHVGAA